MENLPLEELYLLSPEDLPISLDLDKETIAKVRSALDAIAKIDSLSSEEKVIEGIEEAIRALGKVEQIVVKAEPKRDDSPKSTLEEYDEYFNVVRVSGNPALVMLRSLFSAYRDFLLNEATCTTLSPIELLALKESLFELAELMRSIFKVN